MHTSVVKPARILVLPVDARPKKLQLQEGGRLMLWRGCVEDQVMVGGDSAGSLGYLAYAGGGHCSPIYLRRIKHLHVFCCTFPRWYRQIERLSLVLRELLLKLDVQPLANFL